MTYGEKPNTYPAYSRLVLPAWGWGNLTYTFELDMPLSDIQSIVLDLTTEVWISIEKTTYLNNKL